MAGAAGGAATVSGRDGSSTGTGGAGGALTLTAGNAGGDNTVNRTGGAVAITSGSSKGSTVGALISLTAGAGGAGTGATGAIGGAITLTAGAGGSNATTSGAGGDVTISGGLGGAGGTPGAGGSILFKTAPTTTLGEVARFNSATGNLQLGAAFSMGATSSGTQDVILARDAAAAWHMRNGATAQTFRVATSYTDSSNYAAVELNGSISGGSPGLKVKATGTFVAGGYGLMIDNDSTGGIYFRTQGGNRWQIQNAGHWVGSADNTLDIGNSGAFRPRTIYVGTAAIVSGKITVGGSATINQVTKILQGSATIDPASVNAQTLATLGTITVTGAVAGDTVFMGIPSSWGNTNMVIKWSVSGADTITIYGYNPNTVTAIDLPSATVKCYVHQQ